jgi:hypothetical protein
MTMTVEATTAVHADPTRHPGAGQQTARPYYRRKPGDGFGELSSPVFDSAPQRHQRSPAAEIVTLAWCLQPEEKDQSSGMRRGLGAERLLAYLELFPGSTWQERWQASPLEEAGPGVTKDVVSDALGLPSTQGPLYLITAGLGALLALDVVRPSFDYLHGLRTNNLWLQLVGWRKDPDAGILIAAPASDQSRSHSSGVLGRLLVLTGRPVAQLTAADLLVYRTPSSSAATRPSAWSICGLAWRAAAWSRGRYVRRSAPARRPSPSWSTTIRSRAAGCGPCSSPT